MLRALVVDDRADLRQLFAAVLDGQQDLEVVKPVRWPKRAPC